MNNQNLADNFIEQIIKSIEYMLKQYMDRTTKVYDGVIVSSNSDGKWNVRYNGETHSVKPYGGGTPAAGMMVKVIIPQGNQALAWFLTPAGSTE